MGKAFPLPAVARLLAVVSYDASTGIFRWRAPPSARVSVGDVAGHHSKRGYVRIKIDGVLYQAHRLAWLYANGEDPGDLEVDHRNRIRSDNRIDNLRLATRKQNTENVPLLRSNSSGTRGVYFNKEKKRWRAFITNNKQQIFLGSFRRLEDAVARRREVEVQLFSHITQP